MKVLLDTHALLWWVGQPERLSPAARAVLLDPENAVFVSVASCWEMAIKQSLGKLTLSKPIQRLVADEVAANGFRVLSVELAHVVRVATLPFAHKDPFDRLLVAQALVAGLQIVTADEQIRAYAVEVLW